MNIALMSHDNKKDLMVQFCTAYAGILSKHEIFATNTTGHVVAEATGLNIHCFLSYAHGGSQLYGFTPLDTPIIEASEVLLAKGGGETEKQVYRFQKGDSDLSLRFDLTVPLAKYVALHYNELAFPFRRYQIGKVYRGERAQRGRFREFYQADIDVIGDGKLDIVNEAEIPSIIYRTFQSWDSKSLRYTSTTARY
jgi:histidyl-tRNA synthetase